MSGLNLGSRFLGTFKTPGATAGWPSSAYHTLATNTTKTAMGVPLAPKGSATALYAFALRPNLPHVGRRSDAARMMSNVAGTLRVP